MAADLRLVADAAERHAHELAVQRACDRLADRRLARSGRADERQDRAALLVVRDAALLAELPHREVLDDAVLHVLETGVIGVEHFPRVLRVEVLVRPLRPRNRGQPVEVRADHRRLTRGVAHRLEPPQLAVGLRADGLGHSGLFDLRAVLVDDGALVLAELLANRLHLLAQDVLALLLLDVGVDVLANAAAHLQLGQALTLQGEREVETLDDVDFFEQLDALCERDIGRVRARVRKRAGLGDRAQEGADPLVGVANLEDLLDDGAILALELARLDRREALVGTLVDFDAEAPLRIGVRGADDGAVQAAEGDGVAPTGEPDAIGDLGHRPDLRVLVLVLRDEQDAVFVACVDRQGDGHAREDDGVFERNEQQVSQNRSLSNRCTRYHDCTCSQRPVGEA